MKNCRMQTIQDLVSDSWWADHRYSKRGDNFQRLDRVETVISIRNAYANSASRGRYHAASSYPS